MELLKTSPRIFYSGLAPFLVGNALKAGVRFVTFERFKAILVDERGRLSGPRAMLSGALAGIMESVLVVTPAETVKYVAFTAYL